ncbi:MAG: hypothetical protein AAF500_11595 [Myxococcota bacterium]
MSFLEQRYAAPFAIFVVSAAVYGAVSGSRLVSASPNNHYSHLAQAWLDGRLDLGTRPQGTNDWACFDTTMRRSCPPRYDTSAADAPSRYRWFVSFPPLPAVIVLPWVAIFGVSVWDHILWVLIAGTVPAIFFVFLRRLRRTGVTDRRQFEDLLVTALLAFGSVFFFVAVQGSVWFAAHVVGTALVCAYLLFGWGARSPGLAGLALGLAFLSRPATIFLAPFFMIEAMGRVRARRAESNQSDALSLALPFALPLIGCVALAMWHNFARFGDVFEFGHRYLQIRWRTRIETWGLFDLHYLPRNLAVFFGSMPTLSTVPPFIRVSPHGLALWLTTPNLLWSFFPARLDRSVVALWAAILPTALCTLLYQNTGFVQFGPRFALDYLPLLLTLVALSRPRFGPLFYTCTLFALALNAFGAIGVTPPP